jgi:hypothetical protein
MSLVSIAPLSRTHARLC